MARWTCPACEREFDLAHQAHTCAPGGTVADTFAGRPHQRPIYDAIIAYLSDLGPIHEDAVKVGIFLKRQRKIAEVRPMAKALSLELFLPRRLENPRVVRQAPVSRDRVWHTIRLTDPSQVDDELKAWLAEAYLSG